MVTYITLIHDLLTGPYDNPLRVVAFDPVKGWGRDASEDIASALEQQIAAEGREVSEGFGTSLTSRTKARPAVFVLMKGLDIGLVATVCVAETDNRRKRILAGPSARRDMALFWQLVEDGMIKPMARSFA
jgi:hypothetical protein